MAGGKTAKVFISSPSEDLKEFREAASKAAIAAGMLPVMMEYFVASGAKPPLPACLGREWCHVWHGKYSADALSNPQGATQASYRVRRGGSWASGAGSCRSAYRYYWGTALRYGDLGFRVVASVPSRQPFPGQSTGKAEPGAEAEAAQGPKPPPPSAGAEGGASVARFSGGGAGGGSPRAR